MTDRELKYFENQLLNLKEKLKNQYEDNTERQEELRETTSELSSHDNHPGDLASEQYEMEKDITMSNVNRERLQEVNRALDKIESGEYGSCECCDEEISLERLETVPYTRYCVECAQDQEQDSKDFPYFEDETHIEQMRTTNDPNNYTYFDKEDTWQKLERMGSADETEEDYDFPQEAHGSVDKIDSFSTEDPEMQDPNIDPMRFKKRKRYRRRREE
ncbi:TraR/DksA C4-type zinc finger protein [Natranaerobius trueperi]|uniref:Zinc finger DksA/TraR C4-type domain-containing protein n=1 Tax=Natranaerobius trueperi TaxID=759412 RepID=A0A226C1A2_9FIRM|nr:TraR/DksA C4-type zinc finger protein [Natranaerobius trueperi]OWZ84150.1 hypothetical protein CDO51_04580 [Natranaerobius trueperi]